MTFNKTLLTATMLTLGGFAAMSANAADANGSFDVKLNITEICEVNSLTGVQAIDFGSYASGVAVAEATSANAISVNCTNGTAYNIGLAGTGFMTDEASEDTVAYTLRKTAGGEVWGNTGNEVPGTGEGMASDKAQLHPVYASLAEDATDNLTAGSYIDTVNITVTY